MTPGTIVICTDARLSKGLLVEGWRYVVSAVTHDVNRKDRSVGIPDGPCLVQVVGVSTKENKGELWIKSSRFRPLERKDVEDKVNEKIADEIIKEMVWK